MVTMKLGLRIAIKAGKRNLWFTMWRKTDQMNCFWVLP